MAQCGLLCVAQCGLLCNMLCVSSLYMCAFSPAIVLVCARCRWRWPWAVQSSSCSPWWAVRCTTPSPTQPTRSGWTELSSQVLHQGGGEGRGGGRVVALGEMSFTHCCSHPQVCGTMCSWSPMSVSSCCCPLDTSLWRQKGSLGPER